MNLITMAKFDKELDKELFGEDAKFETSKIRVSVMQYNEGMKKLQISRENLNQEDGSYRWGKLGRLTKDEVSAILPLIEKASENL